MILIRYYFLLRSLLYALAHTQIFDEQALANAGIKPSSSKTYAFSDVENALTKLHDGYGSTISCSNGALSQVWYYYNVQGNAIDGEYKATDPRKFFLFQHLCFLDIMLTTFSSVGVEVPQFCQVFAEKFVSIWAAIIMLHMCRSE